VLQKTGTGTAVVELNDTAGLFEPTNFGSPYFNKLDGKQAGLALWNPIDEEWQTIFRGFVEGYTYEIDPSGVVTRIQVELVDGLDYLAGVELMPGNAGDTPPSEEIEGDVFYEDDPVNDRIHAILTDAQWPDDLRTIFSGNVRVKSVSYPPATSALACLQDAADAEFPASRTSTWTSPAVTFHGRHARFNPPMSPPSRRRLGLPRVEMRATANNRDQLCYTRRSAGSRSRANAAIINSAMACRIVSARTLTRRDHRAERLRRISIVKYASTGH
jgi:hypothetical protein